MFYKFWKERRKENEGEPKYISLCYILQYSGEEKEELSKIFYSYMREGVDYDREEAGIMIDYLCDISKDPNE